MAYASGYRRFYEYTLVLSSARRRPQPNNGAAFKSTIEIVVGKSGHLKWRTEAHSACCGYPARCSKESTQREPLRVTWTASEPYFSGSETLL